VVVHALQIVTGRTRHGWPGRARALAAACQPCPWLSGEPGPV